MVEKFGFGESLTMLERMEEIGLLAGKAASALVYLRHQAAAVEKYRRTGDQAR